VARDGSVGPVGGVRQKLLGATVEGGDDPATVFLVPRGNLDDTQGAPVANDVLVVPVDTLDQALAVLEDLRAGQEPADAVALQARG
jgi:PDZ domain-containing protein